MNYLGFSARLFAVLAAAATLCAVPGRAQVPATGTFVESENYIQSPGNSTLASGPNSGGIGNGGAIVSTDLGAAFSGGAHIGFFDYYDWLEYDINIPDDGTYNVIYRYASAWPNNDTFPQDLVFWTSGQRINPPGAPVTANWGDYQMYTLPTPVALKKGVNRFRMRIRPDFGLVATLGGSMNMDYIKFEKSGAYPNLVAVSGKATATVAGSTVPVEGALVFEDAGGTGLFTEAAHITRTDTNGNYTLQLSPGSHQVSAFYNGYAVNTVQASAPGTKDFSLIYNGRFEAELMDGTNPGRTSTDGLASAYASGIYDAGTNKVGAYSANGLVINVGGSTAGKFAVYNHVTVPAAGAYDITLHYSSDKTPDVTIPYQWSVGGGGGPSMSLTGTGDFNTFQDSAPVMVNLKAGVNSLRWTDQDAANFARVDYFTVTASSRPHGTLNVVVADTGGKPVPGAKVTVTGDNGSYTDQADGTGRLSLPLPVGSYTVTASKSGATASVSSTITDGGTATANITLALTAILVEGEAYAASGPDVAGAGVQIASVDTASGGKVLTDLFGEGDPGAASNNYRWAEWVVNAPQAGWYKFGMSYATRYVPTSAYITVDTTSARADILPADTGGSGQYMDFANPSGMPTELPLVQGANRVRITSMKGGINVDYLTFDRDTSKPADTFTTISGTVIGTDGSGSAPIRGAVVYSNANEMTPMGAVYMTLTDAAGHYTLYVPQTGVNGNGTSPIGVLAPGYGEPNPAEWVQPGNSTKNFTLSLNNTPGTTPPTLELDFTDASTIAAEVLGVGSGHVSATAALGQLAFVGPGTDTWIDLNVNVPRSGLYDMGMNYSSDWLPAGSSADLPVSAGGVTVTGSIPMTGAWSNAQYLPKAVTIPLQAGQNTVRLAFPQAGFNINYLDFRRSGDLPPVASTDIDGNGVTDIRDAVLYARRLAGTATGPTPDLNGDTLSNAADVRRILSVAGGLM